MGKALAFYRLLGLDIPDEADDAPHVEVVMNCLRADGADVICDNRPAG
jgi:hypothetical protein